MTRQDMINKIAELLFGRSYQAFNACECLAEDLVDNGVRTKEGLEFTWREGMPGNLSIEPITYEEER